eukprot:3936235-Rhodomonas_salina.4
MALDTSNAEQTLIATETLVTNLAAVAGPEGVKFARELFDADQGIQCKGFFESRQDTEVAVMQSPAHQHIIVCFRGTSGTADFWTDAKFL